MTLPAAQSADWFVKAILAEGNVSACLSQVIDDLREKEKFVAALRKNLGERPGVLFDALSELSTKVRVLENTVKFRLSALSHERRAAWFRQSAATATGPFAGTVLPDPLFTPYDETRTPLIRAGVIECWLRRNLVSYPMRATESCVWKHLLVLNYEWGKLGDLSDYPRLERLPEDLPASLESRALKAFLLNVKAEYLSVYERLKSIYQALLDASEVFWRAAPIPAAQRTRSHQGRDDASYQTAETMRAEFRRRRAQTPTIKRPAGKTSQDLEALRFMGFDEFPDHEVLKQRYHALALEMHPDRDGGNESRFKLLTKSYKHLMKYSAR
jgi:hypothetical protein